ncbi:MAG: segregation/condensation protein A, partial [Oscillospiraceae bacterium]|nr:segregation/condensation protein A [Oscillospiraceae bacterium]
YIHSLISQITIETSNAPRRGRRPGRPAGAPRRAPTSMLHNIKKLVKIFAIRYFINMTFHLTKYDGPLDLLLDLVQKNKMEISDIPIVELTRQFIDYISQVGGAVPGAPAAQVNLERLDIGTEFVVMASHLLWIKSKMLLPKGKNEDEEDPREELAAQLLEYQKFKEAAGELGARQNLGNDIFLGKPQFISPEVRDFTSKDLDYAKLFEALQEVIERKEFIEKKPTNKDFSKIVQKNRTSILAKAKSIMRELDEMGQLSFFAWFDKMEDKDEIIAGFLAVLELLKLNKINFKDGQILKI